MNGYAFLKGYRPNIDVIDIANCIGLPVEPWNDGIVQTLAHGHTPPRYLLLRCVTGYAEIPTLLVDGRDLIDAITFDVLARAIFKPRRPREGRLSLLRLCDCVEDQVRIRWDEVFLKPASRIGEAADLRVREWLSKCTPIKLPLAQPYDTLLIDNWRMLHARSPILPGCENREIQRVYLEHLK